MLTKLPFYYLRHGQTDWNIDHRGQGQTDVPLNDKGLAQAKRASEIVGDLGIKTICTSPLSRALETANIIQAVCGCELVVVEDLIECSWGEREGDVKDQWFLDWKAGRSNPVGAEPYAPFLERALRGINSALEHVGPVLIVSHGGVYWAVQKFAHLGEEFDIPNAIPVLHEPPESDSGKWRASILAELA